MSKCGRLVSFSEFALCNLNATVVGGGTRSLLEVLALNDANWMVGWGYRNGVAQPRAFLLKPN